VKCLILVTAALVLQNLTPSALKSTKQQQHKTAVTQQPTSNEDRSTQDSPVFIKQLPPVQTQEETEQDAQDRINKSANDRDLVWFTGILALVGFLQLLVFGYQAYWLKETVKAAFGQSADMKLSIEQAARSAAAMEKVAGHLEISSATAVESTKMFSERGEMQMRAYVCVQFGTAGAQNKADGAKFGAQAVMLNLGATPAHKVGFRARTEILPIPLPEDFTFPLPKENVGASVLGPHSPGVNITRFVESFVPDADVSAIKNANGKALYIWGIIDYEDVFSKSRTTNFCIMVNWTPQAIFGTFVPKHNEAT